VIWSFEVEEKCIIKDGGKVFCIHHRHFRNAHISIRKRALECCEAPSNSAQRCNLCVIFTVNITIFSATPYAHIWLKNEYETKRKNIFTVNNPRRKGKIRNYFSLFRELLLGLSDGFLSFFGWIEWKMPDNPSTAKEWIPLPLTYNFLQYSYRVLGASEGKCKI
jgi:hypothetical protein